MSTDICVVITHKSKNEALSTVVQICCRTNHHGRQSHAEYTACRNPRQVAGCRNVANPELICCPDDELAAEKRLQRIVSLAVRCILTNQTPVIAAMAQSVSRQEAECWAAAKRMYRFLENERFNHHHLFKGLYEVTRRTYLVVALDPVNFEKPYAKKLEGVSTVHKSTPPNLEGQARLAHGYPNFC